MCYSVMCIWSILSTAWFYPALSVFHGCSNLCLTVHADTLHIIKDSVELLHESFQYYSRAAPTENYIPMVMRKLTALPQITISATPKLNSVNH